MNKYLYKIAFISDVDKQTTRTWAKTLVGGVAGAAIGGFLGHRLMKGNTLFGIGGATLGSNIGSHVADYFAIRGDVKHMMSQNQDMQKQASENKYLRKIVEE